ncbi:tRNA nucleotidyltransferase cca2 isoform X1 [Triticum aestivum]|uniref:tRNA nucleotidyltransferase cca2 isoform X1 n=1 Tax=Triticum aestivum TaxID=4565 RepID=UPI001D00728A|nr:tRNA nucleotidyltransferase cca2-like isoform X1 [Triticum aestivum]
MLSTTEASAPSSASPADGSETSKPGQSKHLETAKIILSDISDITIDFVNLRSEKYAENSRIPTAEYGMPEEDAFRRDLTINSLFYNINTNLVEDLTRRGLEDLKKGLIVTPLPAKVTFLDDPLRVLRAIRFAARFSFTLAGNLKEAASDEKVKLNLRSKISRERIGQEVDHMMSGKYPVDAMCHIRDLGLFYIVFAFPEKTVPPVLDKHDWLCVSHIEAAWNLAQSIGCSVFRGGSGSMSQDEQRRLCMYSALFTPVRNMVYTKKKEVVRYIIGNSLKLNGSDAEAIVQIHAASDKFADLIIFLESNGNLETVKENPNDPISFRCFTTFEDCGGGVFGDYRRHTRFGRGAWAGGLGPLLSCSVWARDAAGGPGSFLSWARGDRAYCGAWAGGPELSFSEVAGAGACGSWRPSGRFGLAARWGWGWRPRPSRGHLGGGHRVWRHPGSCV